MSEASEAAWVEFWDSEEADYEGIEGGFDGGWAAALEWAAGRMEAVGCSRGCSEALPSADDVLVYAPLAGEEPHRPWCPLALAAAIREGR